MLTATALVASCLVAGPTPCGSPPSTSPTAGSACRRFTWWKYGIGHFRNLGVPIDMIATDSQLAARLDTTWIDHVERSTDPPSDRAALLADFHLVTWVRRGTR